MPAEPLPADTLARVRDGLRNQITDRIIARQTGAKRSTVRCIRLNLAQYDTPYPPDGQPQAKTPRQKTTGKLDGRKKLISKEREAALMTYLASNPTADLKLLGGWCLSTFNLYVSLPTISRILTSNKFDREVAARLKKEREQRLRQEWVSYPALLEAKRGLGEVEAASQEVSVLLDGAGDGRGESLDDDDDDDDMDDGDDGNRGQGAQDVYPATPNTALPHEHASTMSGLLDGILKEAMNGTPHPS